MINTQTHTLTVNCPCSPDRERWDEQTQQWVNWDKQAQQWLTGTS